MFRVAPREFETDRVAPVKAAGAALAQGLFGVCPNHVRGYWRSEARLLPGRIAAGDMPGRV